MEVEARTEHKWLQQLVGEWTFEGEAAMEPGQPSEKFAGAERVRAVGDLWVVCEGESGAAGETWAWLLTLGYDPKRERFVGTWVGSMMTHLWIYSGVRDPDGVALTLEAEGPDMKGKLARFKDVHELDGPDRRLLTSSILGEDGKWHQLMTARFRRKR